MKKAIIYICIISSLLLILDTVNAANSLVLFLLAGVVPGTDFRIAPIDMMSATATAITIVVLRITVWPRISSVFFLPAPSVRASRTKRSRRRTA